MSAESSHQQSDRDGPRAPEGGETSDAPTTPVETDAPAATGPMPQAAPKKISRKELRRELKTAKKEAKGYYNQLVHLQADFENLKKRLIREREDYIRQAKEALVNDLLPSLDNLEYAIRHAREQKEDTPLLNGVEMTYKGLLVTMKKFGVVPVESLGRPFDPTYHEAISKVEQEGGCNQVVEEHQRGYLLDNRLLRPALVTIALPAKESGSSES